MGADIRFFVQVKKHFYKEGAYDYYAWDNLPLWTENSEHRKVLADFGWIGWCGWDTLDIIKEEMSLYKDDYEDIRDLMLQAGWINAQEYNNREDDDGIEVPAYYASLTRIKYLNLYNKYEVIRLIEEYYDFNIWEEVIKRVEMMLTFAGCDYYDDDDIRIIVLASI